MIDKFGFVGDLTVSAGLYGSLNVANTLNSHAVLVIAVDELVLQLTDLVDQDTELVGNIGHVLVTGFTPDGQLLLVDRARLAFSGSVGGIPHSPY